MRHPINKLIIGTVLNAPALFSVAMFFLGIAIPELADTVRTRLDGIEFWQYFSRRASATAFAPGAYLFIISMFAMLPFNLLSVVRLGDASGAKEHIGKSILKNRSSDPRYANWGHIGGAVRILGITITMAVLLVAIWAIPGEPSFAKGFERQSWFGFLIIYWVGHQIMLFIVASGAMALRAWLTKDEEIK